ncbi:Transcriptional activator protein AnoR [Pandoraea captiosa]|uniref:Transcriptional activator protein AnoR n=1 Tax=Pandoraea captiosa TaxID=2508302 RepID=A0A5E5AIE7_9BURK|nr:autoinducer binding domain-containing protein [Pandoraea captiosa]VVE73028.1 Transcriptional activator protein AnoR [Pandoraea captiosa]
MSALMHLLETIHDHCHGITDSQKLFLQIDSFAKRIGFEYCSYGFRHHRSATQSEVRVFDSYPTGWMSHYGASGYLDIDPTVVVGAHTDRLLSWRDPTLPQADALWRDANDFGLNHGVARSSWGPHGEFGLLSFSRSTEHLTPIELSSLQVGMGALANYTHESMSRLLRPQHPPFDLASLSGREREVLLWTAEGKTADEIGDILGISTRTVNFHIRNCLDKTGCRNKVQSAIRLVMWR